MLCIFTNFIKPFLLTLANYYRNVTCQPIVVLYLLAGAQFRQLIVAKSHPKKGMFPLLWNRCQKPVTLSYSDKSRDLVLMSKTNIKTRGC